MKKDKQISAQSLRHEFSWITVTLFNLDGIKETLQNVIGEEELISVTCLVYKRPKQTGLSETYDSQITIL